MKELRDQLWDLVYGLLDEADAVSLRERITSDRDVAREYARVKLQSELVAQAAKASDAESEMPSLPERPLLARAASRSPAQYIALAGSLALSVGLLLFAGVMNWSEESPLHDTALALRLEEFDLKNPRMIVVGRPTLERDAANTFEV